MPHHSNPSLEMLGRFHHAAVNARVNAHAPYSHFKVGAALKIAGVEEPVVGCNVENASFGATICAERAALLQAVSRFGTGHAPDWMVLVTDAADPAVPCALCLQVMAELCPPEFMLYLANLEGIHETTHLSALLPRPFTSFTNPAKA